MDPVKALMLATIIQAAYSMPVNDDSPVPPGAVIEGYNVVAQLYGNDLATDIRPDRGDARISYGYVLTNSSGEAIVAIRGTEGIWEWLHDLMFRSVPCPVPGSVGFSEDGFSAIYRSLSLEPGSTTAIATALLQALGDSIKNITVCGHSLGGALATLLGLDLAINSAWNVAVYTYASPRVGDFLFAANYNHAVPNSYRIANRADLVTHTPPPLLYEHVNQSVDLNSISSEKLPLVKFSILCEHSLNTYLFLIGQQFNTPDIPALKLTCAPNELPKENFGLA